MAPKLSRNMKFLILGVIIVSIYVFAYYEQMKRLEALRATQMEHLYQEVLKYGSHLYFDQAPEELLRLNRTHPRLFLTKERIEELRSLIEGSHRDIWLYEKHETLLRYNQSHYFFISSLKWKTQIK